MQLFELFNLIWSARNDMGFGTIMVYLVPTVCVIALAAELMERRYHRQLTKRVRAGEWAVHEARLAKRDFDREVEAWEEAVRRRGGIQ